MTEIAPQAFPKHDRWDRHVLIGWSIGLALVYIIAGLILVPAQYRSRIETIERHRARFDPQATEPGMTDADFKTTANFKPILVTVGIYVDRVVDVSIRETSWTVDFHVWFRWTGHAINPSEGFQVVDGWIESSEEQIDRVVGDEHYVRYRVIAKITKLFEISRFPCDDHLLTINIENPKYLRDELLFVPDNESTGISSRAKISAYEVYKIAATEKPHSYGTSLGDLQIPKGEKLTYSQFKYGLWIQRAGWGFYIKMFQSLYVAVAIAMLALFIKPTNVDPRFGLGIGGLFAAVANSYISNSLIPDTGIQTLADTVNFLGIASIFLTIFQSTFSLYLYEFRGKEALSRRLDLVSFVIIGVGYISLNILLPLMASN